LNPEKTGLLRRLFQFQINMPPHIDLEKTSGIARLRAKTAEKTGGLVRCFTC
jgi:hypothetical protein